MSENDTTPVSQTGVESEAMSNSHPNTNGSNGIRLFDEKVAKLHLTTLFGWLGDADAYLALAAGGSWDPDNARHGTWHEAQFPVQNLDDALMWAEHAAGKHQDVYVAYHPRSDRSRRKESSLPQGRTLWVDGDDGMRNDAIRRVKETGGWVVASGSLGHAHLGFTLDRAIEHDSIENINKQLMDVLGGDTKWDSTALLRLAGTRNYKAGGIGQAVTFTVLPKGEVTAKPVSELLANRATGKAKASKVDTAKTKAKAKDDKLNRSDFAYHDIKRLLQTGLSDDEVIRDLPDDVRGHYRDSDHLREDVLRIRKKLGKEEARAKKRGRIFIDTADVTELSQLGVARRWSGELVDQYHYVPEAACWYMWTGRRWSKDILGVSNAGLQAFIDQNYTAEAFSGGSSQAWDAWLREVRRSGSISGIVQLTRTDVRLALSIERFDADPYSLNTPNGLVNLRTGALLPHDPTMLVTKSTASPCTLDQTPTGFLRFLDETFAGQDPALKEYLLDVLGYALIGEVTEHLLMILHGLGANGKTTLVEILYGILGDYAMPAPTTLLIEDGHVHHPTEKADLVGARLVVAQETEEGARFAESKVKELTGGDRIKARYMRQDFFWFRPSHTIMLVTNHRPRVQSGGPAFWRRARLLPFMNQVAETKQDPYLAERLVQQEGDKILGLLVQRAARYFQRRLPTPEAVKQVTDGYRMENEPLYRWSTECLDTRAGAWVNEQTLIDCYNLWCHDEQLVGVSVPALRRYLRNELKLQDRRSNNVRSWWGAQIRPNTAGARF